MTYEVGDEVVFVRSCCATCKAKKGDIFKVKDVSGSTIYLNNGFQYSNNMAKERFTLHKRFELPPMEEFI